MLYEELLVVLRLLNLRPEYLTLFTYLRSETSQLFADGFYTQISVVP